MKLKSPVIIVASALVVASICFAVMYVGTNINAKGNNSSSKYASAAYVDSRAGSSASEYYTNNYKYIVPNISFIDSKRGYLCLYHYNDNEAYYSLFKTENSGKSWAKTGDNKALCYIRFVNDKVGYGLISPNVNIIEYYDPYSECGDYTLVKTTDGGVTWNTVNNFKGKSVISIDAVNDKVIFVTTYTYTSKSEQRLNLYRSEDGGVTWNEINTPLGETCFANFSFVSSQVGYALYHTVNNYAPVNDVEKELYTTNNGGKTWGIKSKSPAVNKGGSINSKSSIGKLTINGFCDGIKFFADGTGYISPYSRQGTSRENSCGLLKSVDGGHDFSLIKNKIFYYSLLQSDIAIIPTPDFINSNEGFTVYEDNSLYYFKNGGKDWSLVTSIDYWKSIK